MKAPRPDQVALAGARVRCACGTESLVVHPAPWYRHQRRVAVEPACPSCGKSLLDVEVPEGAHTELRVLAELPATWAAAIGAELAEETAALREGSTPDDTDLSVERWTREHEAPEVYATWRASLPAPPVPDTRVRTEAVIATGFLVAYVLFCILV